MKMKLIYLLAEVKDPKFIELGFNRFFTSKAIDEADITYQEQMSEHDVLVNEFGFTEEAWQAAAARAEAIGPTNTRFKNNNMVTFIKFTDDQGETQKGWFLNPNE